MPVRTKDIPELDTTYARDVSFPIRFTEECDVLLDEDQEVIEQALQMITFILSGSIRLYPQFGSAAHLSCRPGQPVWHSSTGEALRYKWRGTRLVSYMVLSRPWGQIMTINVMR